MNKFLQGRKFELECEEMLKYLFKEVTPLYNKRKRNDFIVKDFSNIEYTVECKSTQGDPNPSTICISTKDLEADMLFLKFGDNVYAYKKLKLKNLLDNEPSSKKMLKEIKDEIDPIGTKKRTQ